MPRDRTPQTPSLVSSPFQEKKTQALPDEDERLLRSFLISLEAENQAPGTLRIRAIALRHALAYLRDTMGVMAPLSEVSTEHLREIQAGLLKDKAPATVQNYVMALKKLFTFLQQEGEIRDNPAERLRPPRQPVPVKQPLTIAEVKALFKACDADKGRLGARDRAIITFLLQTGARAAEACALNVGDVDLTQRHVVIERGKGGKGRIVGLGIETLKALDRYLRRRKAQEGEPLFAGRTGQRLTDIGLWFIVNRRAVQAGLDRHIHPHLLRHTAATWLANAGVQEGELRSIMGWTPGSGMVYRYTASTLAQRAREAQRKANILGNLR